MKVASLIFLIFLGSVWANHTNNWAVLVETSRFWFNYRHTGNVLGVYRNIKRMGIPDSQIILMIGDSYACNSRNPRPGTVYQSAYNPIDLYGEDIEVDYRGYEVTVENFIRVVTGRLPTSAPASKKLNTDQYSNILIYMTGHGGNGFLKFQDDNELSSVELADVINQMWLRRRYNEILLITDSCQAESMGSMVYSPNVITVGSSKIGEDSFAHHFDTTIGVFVADRYSYYALQFLEKLNHESKKGIMEFLNLCSFDMCKSTVMYRTDLLVSKPQNVLVTDFFSSTHHIEDGSYLISSGMNYSTSEASTSDTFEKFLNKDSSIYVQPFPSDFVS
ncbi:unnamed protein product [Hymenolepis diminuta]|uniref:GPI-anchor transamidase n=1 Tax=Hymenolepis diminuta TaxID=6216 RepID=A0A564Z2J7_HYMDI|nr:unnamed protein product [Hymenolepis diminuta]